MLSKLKWIIQALAIPASEQVRLFPTFINVADGLALIWEDVLEALEVFREMVSAGALLEIQNLDENILSISGESNSQIWTKNSLYDSVLWEEIRGLAAGVAKKMNWPISSPGSAEGIYIGS
ncbi:MULTISPECIES: hypothetical protein [Pseudomonas]|uniref:hypothetical protein n=1 Tax=Pseudomonas TaxID=286 RepID=UPI0011AF117B|nr:MULTISPECIES: hypothetical protein [Pseudomonas]MBP5107381.1 hypothetical protein [Pseudomonas protegens]MBP5133385.1 hypothetical protein [Pseudomonas protegens]MBP5149251.1 hypothetical protein [Pseudomonas protegens]